MKIISLLENQRASGQYEIMRVRKMNSHHADIRERCHCNEFGQ
jgi:hypothetical protein